MNNLTNVKIVGWFLLINGILITLGETTLNWGLNLSAIFGLSKNLSRSISTALIPLCIYYGYCLLFDNSKIKEKIINKISLFGYTYKFLFVYIVVVFFLTAKSYSVIKLENGIVYVEMNETFGYNSPGFISGVIWDIATRYENSEEINLKINLKFENVYGNESEKTLSPYICDAVDVRKHSRDVYRAYDDWGIGASSGIGALLVEGHLTRNGFTLSR